MNKELLIIEDDPDLSALLVHALDGTPAQISTARTLSQAAQYLASKPIDLCLVDIGMPDGSGLDFFGELMKNPKYKKLQVVFLTGHNEVQDKVQAFSLGAEDYLVKPVDMLELRARVESKLRKTSGGDILEENLRRGQIMLDMVSQKAFLETAPGTKRELPLTFSEFKLLNYLMRNESRTVSREQLLTAVWGANVNVVDRTVDKHISSLRQKMQPCDTYIETVSRAGYRFQVPQK